MKTGGISSTTTPKAQHSATRSLLTQLASRTALTRKQGGRVLVLQALASPSTGLIQPS